MTIFKKKKKKEKRKSEGNVYYSHFITHIKMLGSKTLGTNVLELQFVNMLANHDQNIQSRFRLAQSLV